MSKHIQSRFIYTQNAEQGHQFILICSVNSEMLSICILSMAANDAQKVQYKTYAYIQFTKQTYAKSKFSMLFQTHLQFYEELQKAKNKTKIQVKQKLLQFQLNINKKSANRQIQLQNIRSFGVIELCLMNLYRESMGKIQAQMQKNCLKQSQLKEKSSTVQMLEKDVESLKTQSKNCLIQINELKQKHEIFVRQNLLKNSLLEQQNKVLKKKMQLMIKNIQTQIYQQKKTYNKKESKTQHYQQLQYKQQFQQESQQQIKEEDEDEENEQNQEDDVEDDQEELSNLVYTFYNKKKQYGDKQFTITQFTGRGHQYLNFINFNNSNKKINIQKFVTFNWESLVTLDITSNCIGDQGFKLLTKLTMPILKKLCLKYNNLSNLQNIEVFNHVQELYLADSRKSIYFDQEKKQVRSKRNYQNNQNKFTLFTARQIASTKWENLKILEIDFKLSVKQPNRQISWMDFPKCWQCLSKDNFKQFSKLQYLMCGQYVSQHTLKSIRKSCQQNKNLKVVQGYHTSKQFIQKLKQKRKMK